MKIFQSSRGRQGTATTGLASTAAEAQLVLLFSSAAQLLDDANWVELRSQYPKARIVGVSTAGEIAGPAVLDDSLTSTALRFEGSHMAIAAVGLDEANTSLALGHLIATRLPKAGLRHVLVFSDGLRVNGSSLVAGMLAELPASVAVTGGLSGDGPDFRRTAVCLDGPAPHEQVVAVGLYGDGLRIGWGSAGGWDPFGVERLVTRSEDNVLYELDGEPALDLYKRYLGEEANALPASALRFPLTIRAGESDNNPIVRTILSVDETRKSMTFAGDVPVGHRARLMKSNVERLIDGAYKAGTAATAQQAGADQLALLVSCVGRKLVMKQRVEEEVEAVRDALGGSAAIAGFYSYGELSPTPGSRCDLHNQTMTITTLGEAA